MNQPRLLGWLKRHPLLSGGCLTFAAFLTGLLLLTSSCSDLPTQPTSELAADGSEGAKGGAELGRGVSSAGDALTWTVVQTINKGGGMMKLDGTELKCTFPAGALSRTTRFTATMRLDAPRGEATRVDIEFQPSVSFQAPIKLKVAKDYLAGNNPHYVLWYFDPTLGAWVKSAQLPEGDASTDGFDLDHFSQYAVTR